MTHQRGGDMTLQEQIRALQMKAAWKPGDKVLARCCGEWRPAIVKTVDCAIAVVAIGSGEEFANRHWQEILPLETVLDFAG